MPRFGAYSQQTAVAGLDGRSAEARAMKRTREELTAHVGGTPSAVQRALIDRAVMLTHQLALLDKKRAGGMFTEHDAKAYIAWSNAHVRLLRQLGMRGQAERPRTYQEIVAARDAKAQAAA